MAGRSHFPDHPYQSSSLVDVVGKTYLHPGIYQYHLSYLACLQKEVRSGKSLYFGKENHEQEQELNQERLRFYTNITHELRTPLTLILGPLEDMQKEASLPAKQAQKLSVIHQSALRLLNLINQILEFRKTETQNKKLCVSKGNIAPLIYEIGLKYKELNQNTKIDFRIQIEKEEMVSFLR